MCSCELLALGAFYSAIAAFFALAFAVLQALGGHASVAALLMFVVFAAAYVVCMVARRALQVSAARLGYYPARDGGVVLRGERRPTARVTAGAPRTVVEGVRLGRPTVRVPDRRLLEEETS